MKAFSNPALAAFVSGISSELVLAQVLIRREGKSVFELRHIQDRTSAPSDLRRLEKGQIRNLAQFTGGGAFRPLKSAPNLQAGWLLAVSSEADLEWALNQLYPNAMADWFAHNFRRTPPTNYREFTKRQSGMYRITAMLTDTQAVPVVRACCHQKFCLKQRLWTVGDLPQDARETKSLIPCLEPCAILLEFARKAMRLEQAAERGEINAEEPTGEVDWTVREADFEDPKNPRRVQLAIEKRDAAS